MQIVIDIPEKVYIRLINSGYIASNLNIIKAIKKGIVLPNDQGCKFVTCKNCIHNGSYDTDCPISWFKTEEDYCSYGEEKD